MINIFIFEVVQQCHPYLESMWIKMDVDGGGPVCLGNLGDLYSALDVFKLIHIISMMMMKCIKKTNEILKHS